MKRHLQNKEECYLCGAPATTRDHIPPLGMFPKPRPHDLITAPACDNCNKGRSLDDEYFRVVVAAGSRDSPQSHALLHQRILPRMRKNPALIANLMTSVRWVDLQSKGNIYLGRGPAFPFDRPRIQAVIDKIVRGIFFKHTGRRLAPDHIVERFLYNPLVEKPFQEIISTLPLYNIGDGTIFSYRYYLPDTAGSESFWFLMFYNDTSFFITHTSSVSNSQINPDTAPASRKQESTP